MTNVEQDFFIPFGQGVIGYAQMWGRDLRTGWYPCENPERSTDSWVLWHYEGKECLGCKVSAKALLLRNPNSPHVQWLNRQLGNEVTNV